MKHPAGLLGPGVNGRERASTSDSVRRRHRGGPGSDPNRCITFFYGQPGVRGALPEVGSRRGKGVLVTIANVRLALRALGSTRLRTTLTLLGVLIGTAAVIMLVGVVTGLEEPLQRRMDALGTKAVWILPNENPDNEAGTKSRFTRLRPADVDALRDPDRAPDIVAVEPVARTGG